MRKDFFVVNLFLLGWFCSASVFAQQDGDAKISASNPAFARAQQLIAFIDAKQANAVKQALSDEHWYVRGQAAVALGRIGDKSASPLLLPLLQDQSWFVRTAALEALERLGAPADQVALRELITSPDAFVRARAVALASGTSSADSLMQALGDPNELVRRSAATRLGVLKAANAVDPLLALLKDEDPAVRKAAAVALGRIGDKRTASAVLASLPGSVPSDWEYAAALYRLGNRDYLDLLTAALRSEYADDQQSALKTLLEFGDAR